MLLTVVAAALIDTSGKVLVQKRPPGKFMAGLWEFPGGKVEADETSEIALARELNEELGIDVDPGDFEPASFASEPLGDRHLLLLLYVCRKWRGTAEPKEAAALKWIDVQRLAELEMPPADIPLAQRLDRLISRTVPSQ